MLQQKIVFLSCIFSKVIFFIIISLISFCNSKLYATSFTRLFIESILFLRVISSAVSQISVCVWCILFLQLENISQPLRIDSMFTPIVVSTKMRQTTLNFNLTTFQVHIVHKCVPKLSKRISRCGVTIIITTNAFPSLLLPLPLLTTA